VSTPLRQQEMTWLCLDQDGRAGFPSGPFPLSGCFALNSPNSAFPSPPLPPTPPVQSGAGRMRDVLGFPMGPPGPHPALDPTWSRSQCPARPLLPEAGSTDLAVAQVRWEVQSLAPPH
jgi:hypothetical protein